MNWSDSSNENECLGHTDFDFQSADRELCAYYIYLILFLLLLLLLQVCSYWTINSLFAGMTYIMYIFFKKQTKERGTGERKIEAKN